MGKTSWLKGELRILSIPLHVNPINLNWGDIISSEVNQLFINKPYRYWCDAICYISLYHRLWSPNILLRKHHFSLRVNYVYSEMPFIRGRRGRYRMIVGFTTTYAISAYHHLSCEFEPCSWRGGCTQYNIMW